MLYKMVKIKMKNFIYFAYIVNYVNKTMQTYARKLDLKPYS